MSSSSFQLFSNSTVRLEQSGSNIMLWKMDINVKLPLFYPQLQSSFKKGNYPNMETDLDYTVTRATVDADPKLENYL
jgi:hypothetical protein